MATLNNIDGFKSTVESYTSDAFNITHDGTAITLGNEPSVTNVDLAGDWTIELLFKSSVITEQCLISIDDGAGGRLVDVMHRDGDKIVLFYEGVETIITYTTNTLPDTSWTHMAFGYRASDNTLGIGCQTTSTTVTVTNDIPIPTTRLVRFFSQTGPHREFVLQWNHRNLQSI